MPQDETGQDVYAALELSRRVCEALERWVGEQSHALEALHSELEQLRGSWESIEHSLKHLANNPRFRDLLGALRADLRAFERFSRAIERSGLILAGGAALRDAVDAFRDLRANLERSVRECQQAAPLRQPPDDRVIRERLENLRRLRRELADLPVQNPHDGVSRRDHDDEPYGGPQ